MFWRKRKWQWRIRVAVNPSSLPRILRWRVGLYYAARATKLPYVLWEVDNKKVDSSCYITKVKIPSFPNSEVYTNHQSDAELCPALQMYKYIIFNILYINIYLIHNSRSKILHKCETNKGLYLTFQIYHNNYTTNNITFIPLLSDFMICHI